MATVLVVDDVKNSRTLLGRLLQDAGFDVIPAAGGWGALEAMDARAIDVVLLDLQMRDMNGLQFLERVRGEARWDAVRIIVLTGMRDGVTFRMARQLGADKFLMKGQVSPAQLVEHIRRQLLDAIPDRNTLEPTMGRPLLIGNEFVSHAPGKGKGG